MSERTPSGILPGQVSQLTTTHDRTPCKPRNLTVTPTAHGQTITQGETPRERGDFKCLFCGYSAWDFTESGITRCPECGKPPAQWTTTPPTDPGWYWTRCTGCLVPMRITRGTVPELGI